MLKKHGFHVNKVSNAHAEQMGGPMVYMGKKTGAMHQVAEVDPQGMINDESPAEYVHNHVHDAQESEEIPFRSRIPADDADGDGQDQVIPGFSAKKIHAAQHKEENEEGGMMNKFMTPRPMGTYVKAAQRGVTAAANKLGSAYNYMSTPRPLGSYVGIKSDKKTSKYSSPSPEISDAAAENEEGAKPSYNAMTHLTQAANHIRHILKDNADDEAQVEHIIRMAQIILGPKSDHTDAEYRKMLDGLIIILNRFIIVPMNG